MYCPVCFCNSLTTDERGVAHLSINGKRRDSGRILFSDVPEEKVKFVRTFTKKVKEFFDWYDQLTNKDPIRSVELITPNVKCSNKCQLPPHAFFPVTEELIPKVKLREIVYSTGEKYDFKIKLES